ncbi:family 2 glycosyl transferase [[Phormidium ambiguum] IAM M-71]|uniref:Family 2 glycosyl transferase n=1 Tax=[Phormidium ambiguum] IAM M-71 TaxID=454136 RepID=A0A1U7IS29_9CYAN|nr:glycosyltransferase family 2 protein [Phormidium ambiguum]OKH40170.1 family 2 glycosyl transferase [Phormidium ambiguum IAM M-71]
MSIDLPLISVIIPAYNAEAFIAETLHSVLSQTYPNIEILVVDDGSQDSTPNIVELFAEKNPHIILLRQSNKGVAAARNLAIEKSKGEYIAPIDADDIWFPEKLEKQMQVMLESDRSLGIVYAWSVYINEDSTLTKTCQTSYFEGNIYIPLLYGNCLGNASSPLIRRSCINQVGGYSCQLKEQQAQGCEDWDIYLRIAEYYKVKVVPEVLIGYRQVIGSMSFNAVAMKKSFQLVFTNTQQRYPEIPASIYHWSSSNFNWYLALRSYQCGDHWSTIFYIYQAAKLDYLPLLRPSFYKLLVKSILKIIAKPITSLIWPEHRDWLKFKRKFRFFNSVIDIPELNEMYKKNHQKFPWKHYIVFISKRCSQIEKQWKPADRKLTLNSVNNRVSSL